MNAQQREQLRLSLLRFLGDVSSTLGMNTGMLKQLAQSEGRRGLLEGEVLVELRYLEDKGLVAPLAKAISPENPAWRITADGRDFLAVNLGE